MPCLRSFWLQYPQVQSEYWYRLVVTRSVEFGLPGDLLSQAPGWLAWHELREPRKAGPLEFVAFVCFPTAPCSLSLCASGLNFPVPARS